jgi:hypothetical protein
MAALNAMKAIAQTNILRMAKRFALTVIEASSDLILIQGAEKVAQQNRYGYR